MKKPLNLPYLKIALCCWCFAIFVSCEQEPPSSITKKEQKPNVILIITDDQGYGDLGCHGNPYIQTPHLDDFHKEALRLTDFHVSPICAPTKIIS